MLSGYEHCLYYNKMPLFYFICELIVLLIPKIYIYIYNDLNDKQVLLLYRLVIRMQLIAISCIATNTFRVFTKLIIKHFNCMYCACKYLQMYVAYITFTSLTNISYCLAYNYFKNLIYFLENIISVGTRTVLY